MEFLSKLKFKVNYKFRQITKYNFILYKSYLHMKLKKRKLDDAYEQYVTARPNPGAGIGHQMSNWIAGYHYAKVFNMKFAHYPFSNYFYGKPYSKWEKILNFGYGETKIDELKKKGYKAVYLPKFDENSIKQMQMISAIISSYAGEKVFFVFEQDQFWYLQYEDRTELRNKYMLNKKNRKLHLFQNDKINIAIHVRRGDISNNTTQNSNFSMRWQDNIYFYNVLSSVLQELKDLDINVLLFSQGRKSDFKEFVELFPDIKICTDLNAEESFWHMTQADVLITSKSSFSYKPALLSKGVIISPANFWHGYPDDANWIVINDDIHGIMTTQEINDIRNAIFSGN